MQRSRTLSGRLTLYTVATFTMLLLVCFTLLYWSVSKLLAQRMDQDLLEDIVEFSHTLTTHGVSDVIQEIDKETANEEHESVFLMLLDADMNTVHQSDMTFWPDLALDLELVSRQLQPGAEPGLQTVDVGTQEAPTRIVYGYLPQRHVLVLGESTEEQEDITDLLVHAFLIVFLLAVPVAAFLVWLVTRRTVSGIHRVSVAARAISNGNLDVRVNARGQLEEVQTLADTFDAMAERTQVLIHHMREMTDNIAHDLRSPLGRIRLISESLLHKADNTVEVNKSAMDTVAECDRLIQMIDLSLDVAEAEAGVLTLETRLTDLYELVQDACDFYQPAFELKNIRLERSLSQGSLVMADSNSLQRLLSNLLDNALKHTPENGEISVSLTRHDGYIDLSVSDTGEGIPAVSLEHVFDRFYRADSSRGGKGCGLGLSYAHAVAKAHGGDLSVRSTPGIQTVFTLRLHCSPTLQPETQQSHRPAVWAQTRKRDTTTT